MPTEMEIRVAKAICNAAQNPEWGGCICPTATDGWCNNGLVLEKAKAAIRAMRDMWEESKKEVTGMQDGR